MSPTEKKQREQAEVARIAEEERVEAARIAEKERVEAARTAEAQQAETARKVAANWDKFLRTSWFDIGGYFDMHFLEERLYGGKFGMDLGMSHFTIGAYLAMAGYKASYISKSDPSDSGTVGGFGFGGDFSVGYSGYVGAEDAGNYSNPGWIPVRGTISMGITLLYFIENPLNVPSIFPYLRLSGRGGPFVVGLKLELPVINEKFSPRFGLALGFGGARVIRP
jgi:hypothetical protein